MRTFNQTTASFLVAFSAYFSPSFSLPQGQINTTGIASVSGNSPLTPKVIEGWSIQGYLQPSQPLDTGLEGFFLDDIINHLKRQPPSGLVSPSTTLTSYTSELDVLKVSTRWPSSSQRLTYGESVFAVSALSTWIDDFAMLKSDALHATVSKMGVEVIVLDMTEERSQDVEFEPGGALEFSGKFYPERTITGGALAVKNLLEAARRDVAAKPQSKILSADWTARYRRHDNAIWFDRSFWDYEDLTYADLVSFVDGLIAFYDDKKVYGTLRGFGDYVDQPAKAAFSFGLERCSIGACGKPALQEHQTTVGQDNQLLSGISVS